MSKKFLDLAGLTAYDGKLKEWIKTGVVDITNDAINALFVTVTEGPADNEIWYTSSDGNVVTPYITTVFGASIVSNTYEDGKGVITFDGNVTSMGNGVFEALSSLTSITIPNSVTSIGKRVFGDCTGLISINIPNSVTSIGPEAFWNCPGLNSITIPSSVTSIEYGTFGWCSGLTSVTIPNSVTSIGYMAFLKCSSLTSITIPNSVTSIGDEAFLGCSGLTSITFEGTIEQWNSITKGENWNNNIPATYVQCTDGQVQL